MPYAVAVNDANATKPEADAPLPVYVTVIGTPVIDGRVRQPYSRHTVLMYDAGLPYYYMPYMYVGGCGGFGYYGVGGGCGVSGEAYGGCGTFAGDGGCASGGCAVGGCAAGGCSTGCGGGGGGSCGDGGGGGSCGDGGGGSCGDGGGGCG
ncbi:hypothetical protein SDRG_10758 [Saprolegnia diclina VS20]|uniref:Uncharacterized protein n=1 Tax=Saprolegnia diclina (strain VS20) TaxID=1156394 RepID=T0RH08_SAPDV|nr:hypothetical protein SDRG_10758 [Saprolegnia diclina VS20]EQC31588.1 hypothetical protein SDRG_10758 [Saprolegnia diclina VS20]|eukprot:XP_008614987.1 hypothetical protein SDRG_10758 [Saprolegnia diclina VS20]